MTPQEVQQRQAAIIAMKRAEARARAEEIRRHEAK